MHLQTDDKASLIELRMFELDGNLIKEYFIDGKLQGLTNNEAGELFMTKQPSKDSDESIIYKSNFECPISWDEISSSFDFSYQTICSYDKNTLAVFAVSFPINIYSKQSIKWVDSNSGTVLGSFSLLGEKDGSIYFPRCIQRHQDGVVVLDKTGRFQMFSRSGDHIKVLAKIDNYLGNGFTINGDEAITVCSGLVVNKEGQTICDDWVESIKLDGSRSPNSN